MAVIRCEGICQRDLSSFDDEWAWSGEQGFWMCRQCWHGPWGDPIVYHPVKFDYKPPTTRQIRNNCKTWKNGGRKPKLKYDSYLEAWNFAVNFTFLKGGPLKMPYECLNCKKWHLGTRIALMPAKPVTEAYQFEI